MKVLAFIVTLALGNARAATYYVDTNHPSANNANTGTSETLPWKTIQKAATTLAAGDTVFVKQGTYTGSVVPANSGTSSSRITYSAFPGHERLAVINGAGFAFTGKSYITINGFKIQEVLTGTERGIDVVGPAAGITISGNYVYHTRSSSIAVWGREYPTVAPDGSITRLLIENNKIERGNDGGFNENITVANGVDGFEIRNNEILNAGPDDSNGGEGIDAKLGVTNGKIWRNHIHNNKRIGIYIDGVNRYATNLAIYKNRVHDNVGSEGINIGKEEPGGIGDNIQVYNNIVYNNGRNGILLFKHPDDDGLNMSDVTIINNTTYNNGLEAGNSSGGVKIDYPTAVGVVVRNNIAFRNQNFQIDTDAGTVDFNLTTDPSFVNAAAGDFHVRSSSAAIDSGSSSLAPSADFDDVSRPQGSAFDIGAYEHASDVISPSVPSRLSATPVSSLQINLLWNASTDNVGVTGYKVYRGGIEVASSLITSHQDMGLSPSTLYTYTVAAFDAAGNTSAQSTSVSATTLGGGVSGVVGIGG